MGAAPDPTDEKGRVTVAFRAWMMGFPAGYFDGVKRVPAARMTGNAVQVQVAETVARFVTAQHTRNEATA